VGRVELRTFGSVVVAITIWRLYRLMTSHPTLPE